MGDLRRSPPGNARDQREWSVAATQGARAEDEIQGQAEAPGHGLTGQVGVFGSNFTCKEAAVGFYVGRGSSG